MNDKLYEALALLVKTSPWATWVLKHTKITIKEDHPSASVRATNDCYLLDISSKFFDNLDVEGLAFILEHEVLHIIYAHVGAEWAMKNPKVANIAADAIINESTVLKSDHDILKNKVTFKSLKEFYDIDVTLENTSIEIFEKLLDNIDKTKGSKGRPENFDSTKVEDLNESDQCAVDKHLNSGPKIEMDKVEKEIGDAPGHLVREISKYNKTINDNFRSLFKMFVGNALRQSKRSTWKRPSRRFGHESKGRIKDAKPKILIVVDTSASMSDDALEKINYQISYILKKFSLFVCWGDTEQEGYKEFKKGGIFDAEFQGGGGTDLNFWEKTKENFDLVIFNTDGYIPEITNKKQKRVFCIFDEGVEVPNEHNIRF